MAPGSYLVISHAVMSPGHATGHQPLSEAARELGEARKGMPQAAARIPGGWSPRSSPT